METPSRKGERNPFVGLICCLRFAASLGCGKEIVEFFQAFRLLTSTAHPCQHHKQTGGTKLHMQSQNCGTVGVTGMVGWLAQLACCDGQVYALFRKGRQGKQSRVGPLFEGAAQMATWLDSGQPGYFWVVS